MDITELEAELNALRDQQEDITEKFLELRKAGNAAEANKLQDSLKDLKVVLENKIKEIKAVDPDWKEKKRPKKRKPKAKTQKKAAGKTGPTKTTADLMGLQAKKTENFALWYSDVITRAELIEYYDISGCYILRPWAYSMWESVVKFFDDRIKESGVQNAYFPLLVSKGALEQEKNHIEGFAPEVAWVTRSGQSELPEPVAIRPTSETIMYPAYAKWIRSHRDLPLRLNQWTNIVRWEFKNPVPFLRSREFLWQEGHSAFATKAEADVEVREILDYYRRVYEEVMAVPVVCGQKSELEKFAGGDYTTTIEAFIPQNGRGIQAATSHCLGQNFSKMFEITFEDENRERQFAWQNSWGLTTRTLGVLVMVHGDDKGLVLPPKVAPIQAVLVPIYIKDQKNEELEAKCREMQKELTDAGVLAHFDNTKHNPGFKYNHWELKGVPVRIEFGPRDLKNNTCVLVRRDYKDGDKNKQKKETISCDDLATRVVELLDDIQSSLFAAAKKERDSHLVTCLAWDDFMAALDEGNIVLVPWCDREECEEHAKAKSGGKEFVEVAQEQKDLEKQRELENRKKKLMSRINELNEELEEIDAALIGSMEELQEKRRLRKEQQKQEMEEKQKGKQKEEEETDTEQVVEGFGLKASAKTLCKPFDQPELPEGTPCFNCGQIAT
eukprot:CAMPEP_0174251072 /NCGR_PEP_ID=MMETSP0439-20130205/1022_1 /TAXON_ID=0 /ORGANISM="Stereomyxa ramosa, Strain Chinc5" /LENGTH=667 /DNA_ID=CAMNT_0015331303 /DNA_START=33 /DNA_END=2033 /DNA_ORIENTATION=+